MQGLLDSLERAYEGYERHRINRLNEDIVRSQYLQPVVPVTTTDPQPAPFQDTLRDTFTNPTNLLLLGVATVLGVVLVTR